MKRFMKQDNILYAVVVIFVVAVLMYFIFKQMKSNYTNAKPVYLSFTLPASTGDTTKPAFSHAQVYIVAGTKNSLNIVPPPTTEPTATQISAQTLCASDGLITLTTGVVNTNIKINTVAGTASFDSTKDYAVGVRVRAGSDGLWSPFAYATLLGSTLPQPSVVTPTAPGAPTSVKASFSTL